MKILIVFMVCFIFIQSIHTAHIKQKSYPYDSEIRNLLKDLLYSRDEESMRYNGPYESSKRQLGQEEKTWSKFLSNMFNKPEVIYGRKQQWDSTYGK